MIFVMEAGGVVPLDDEAPVVDGLISIAPRGSAVFAKLRLAR